MSLSSLARIVVFGAEYCSFCNRAKSLLEKANANFEYLDVEEEPVLVQLQQLQRELNYKTIPMVFIDRQFIGGYKELYQMVHSRQLDLDHFK
jgi:glutaredoxin 3